MSEPYIKKCPFCGKAYYDCNDDRCPHCGRDTSKGINMLDIFKNIFEGDNPFNNLKF